MKREVIVQEVAGSYQRIPDGPPGLRVSSFPWWMLPNRFPDQGDQPEFNSVDASLWYIIAVYEYLNLAEVAGDSQNAEVLRDAVCRILQGYADGTRFGIRVDEDGLLMAGTSGVQLTWMEAPWPTDWLPLANGF